MRSHAAAALLALGLLGLAAAADPPLPRLQGFVTDDAGVISPAVRTRLTRLIEELREKTGAEIAVVTVQSTAPLDDFNYAMRLAEAWKPGRKGEDTGVVFLVAVRDRRLRVLVGYGLEGILPDGLVGAIQDEEVVPRFRAGQVDEGIWHGVAALAGRIADARGVTLTGAPARRAAPPPPPPIPFPVWRSRSCSSSLSCYTTRPPAARATCGGGAAIPPAGVRSTGTTAGSAGAVAGSAGLVEAASGVAAPAGAGKEMRCGT
jgi:uncharacterized protein